MLTRISVNNFKRLGKAVIDLDNTVVLIGPNNSGKTSALQAFALWEAGLKAWISKRGNSDAAKRTGVTINRKDLIALSVPHANLLWKDLHVRSQVSGKTKNILIEILVEGQTNNNSWECGLEFDFANPESFYCRPLRKDAEGKERYPLPEMEIIREIKMAFLPAMSGLASVEPRLERGRINVLIGEGQTAQVLRNLCYGLSSDKPALWAIISEQIHSLFGIRLGDPEYVFERGEVLMSYSDEHGIVLDLSSAGRGLQQALLLLSYLYSNPGSVLLLDEPDAHLEILRQRQMYNLLQEISREQGCQIIAASHSEVILNEAIDKDTVIAFVGTPHVVKRSQQVLKSLQTYGFEHYYQAEEKGWVLYLEGSTDLAILKAWAKVLNHPVQKALDAPFVHYVQNNSPKGAEEHFYALLEANEKLKGVAVFDRISSQLKNEGPLFEVMWKRREIENYLTIERVIVDYIIGPEPDPEDLFEGNERKKKLAIIMDCISDIEKATSIMDKPSIWSTDIKASEEFLEPLFKQYAKKTNTPIIRKNRFYELASYMHPNEIDPEVVEKLDIIWDVAETFESKE